MIHKIRSIFECAKEVKFCKETNSWVIDGRIVTTDLLTETDLSILKKKCSGQWELIKGDQKSPQGQLII